MLAFRLRHDARNVVPAGAGLAGLLRAAAPLRILTMGIVAGTLALLPQAPAAAASASDLTGKIYLLTPNAQVTRFEAYDKPNMEAALKRFAPNLQLVVLSADNNPSRQLEQAQAAITEGAKGIFLAPPVPNQSQSVVSAAHEAGIPVIGYAYNSDNSDIDYYVTVPFEPIGEAVAKYAVSNLGSASKPLKIGLVTGDPSFFFDREIVSGTDKVLKPLIADGSVKVVCKNDNLQLSEENARTAVEGCIEQAPNGLDAILVHNDSSANGAIAALAAQNLLGKVKVFGGYDSQAGTIQQLLAGNIGNDMVPPYKAMAESAVKLMVAVLSKSADAATMVNGTYDNGKKKVPAVFNQNVFVTAENVKSELIDPGLLTMKEVCAGPALVSSLCKK